MIDQNRRQRRQLQLLHIRVRAFAGVGDEAVDPRCDNSESIREQAASARAELEHGIGMVTTALRFKCGKGDTFKSRRVQFFRREQSYELKKNHSPWLRSSMRFRSLDGDGADERAWWFDGTNGNARRVRATFDGTHANAPRSDDEFTLGLPPLWQRKLQSK
jgi:hypothetical protein